MISSTQHINTFINFFFFLQFQLWDSTWLFLPSRITVACMFSYPKLQIIAVTIQTIPKLLNRLGMKHPILDQLHQSIHSDYKTWMASTIQVICKRHIHLKTKSCVCTYLRSLIRLFKAFSRMLHAWRTQGINQKTMEANDTRRIATIRRTIICLRNERIISR